MNEDDGGYTLPLVLVERGYWSFDRKAGGCWNGDFLYMFLKLILIFLCCTCMCVLCVYVEAHAITSNYCAFMLRFLGSLNRQNLLIFSETAVYGLASYILLLKIGNSLLIIMRKLDIVKLMTW